MHWRTQGQQLSEKGVAAWLLINAASWDKVVRFLCETLRILNDSYIFNYLENAAKDVSSWKDKI